MITSSDNFHLSTNQARRAEALLDRRNGKTPAEMVSQIIEMGLYQLEYRQKRNKEQAQLKKLGKEALRLVNDQSNVKTARALAIALGLAVDDDVITEMEE